MNYPIFENPLRAIALGILIYAGAKALTCLVTWRTPHRSVPVLLVVALFLVLISEAMR